MREYAAAGEVTIDPTDNALSAMFAREAADPDAPAMAYRDGDRFAEIRP